MEYAGISGIKIIHLTPYYAQANEQVWATNKIIKNIVEKTIEEKPCDWNEVLKMILWTIRASNAQRTGTTTYAFTYRDSDILPMEIMVKSLRVAIQNQPNGDECAQSMFIEFKELDKTRLDALDHLQS